jgi:hypothetical protein
MVRTKTAEKQAKIPPPRYLSRAEKSHFTRIVESKAATNSPVLHTEIDLLADYVSSRSRIAELRRMLAYSLDGGRHAPSWHKLIIGNVRQLEASTKFAMRLAKALGLTNGGD